MQSILLLKPRLDIPFKGKVTYLLQEVKFQKLDSIGMTLLLIRLAYHKNLGTVNTLGFFVENYNTMIEFMKKN